VDGCIKNDLQTGGFFNFFANFPPNYMETNAISQTSFGKESPYSKLWYVDNKNKICITFTPRGGCSIVFQQFLELVGLLETGLAVSPFIHKYRNKVLSKTIKHVDIGELQVEGYMFIKFIMNPYIRAVTIFRHQTSHNLSFREYLKQLVNGQTDYFTKTDKHHLHPQYIDGEENVINHYVKIDKYETLPITLHDGTQYVLDVNKFTSIHHGKKTENTTFCGDVPRNEICNNLPKSYRYFYDDEIKKLVEEFYKNDVEKYGYVFFDE
jgi:hypothetical protein